MVATAVQPGLAACLSPGLARATPAEQNTAVPGALLCISRLLVKTDFNFSRCLSGSCLLFCDRSVYLLCVSCFGEFSLFLLIHTNFTYARN